MYQQSVSRPQQIEQTESFRHFALASKKSLAICQLDCQSEISVCELYSVCLCDSQSNKDTHRHTEQDASSWAGAEDLKKFDEEMEPGMDKWKTSSPSSSSQGEDVGQKTGLSMSQTGSWRRGMSAQVGITPPRTKGTSTSLKTPGIKLLYSCML